MGLGSNRHEAGHSVTLSLSDFQVPPCHVSYGHMCQRSRRFSRGPPHMPNVTDERNAVRFRWMDIRDIYGEPIATNAVRLRRHFH